MSDTSGTQPTQKPRIIIIDDSRLVRVSLANVLSAEFEITEAIDGEEGWEKIIADPQIQVVLTYAVKRMTPPSQNQDRRAGRTDPLPRNVCRTPAVSGNAGS